MSSVVHAPTAALPAQLPAMGAMGSATPQRPSPWHEIAHSLSEAPSPIPTPPALRANHVSPTRDSSNLATPEQTPPVAPLSSSLALREWEELLAQPASEFKRHHLVHVPSNSCLATPTGIVPKLAAERDKEGHIEYKLKLIDPTPERFEKLVTQMLWRLKQGRGEAIYEIGLADDGTVIGLTRSEMDASLQTLEQMAGEVDGTVLILKEIVLYGTISNLPSPAPDLSSSVSSTDSSLDGPPEHVWTIRRPDLDDQGRPRRGSKEVSNKKLKYDKKQLMLRRAGIKAESGHVASDCIPGDRKGMLDPLSIEEDHPDLDADSLDSSSPDQSCRDSPTSPDEDVPPFHLDLDESPVILVPPKVAKKPHKSKVNPPPTPQQLSKKAREKAEKAAARREKRRLELFRGDGTNPDWSDLAAAAAIPPAAKDGLPTIPDSVPNGNKSVSSTLRLGSESPSPPSPDGDDFLVELLHLPIDNLSLSFAEVQTVVTPSPHQMSTSLSSSPSTATELARSPLDDSTLASSGANPARLGSGTRYYPPPPGEELICVEALVVRKSRIEGRWDYNEDDGWGFEPEEEDPWDFS